jgi:hypothetical protein
MRLFIPPTANSQTLVSASGGAERSVTFMRDKSPKIQMRIINTRYPRFTIVSRNGFYWTGEGWSRWLRNALLYADADLLRDDIERLRVTNE